MKSEITRQVVKSLLALQEHVKYSKLNITRLNKDYLDAEADYTWKDAELFYSLPQEARLDEIEIRTRVLRSRETFAI